MTSMMNGKKSEIVDLSPLPEQDIYQLFELHHELAIQIKMALDSKHRRDPEVRIELPFDRLLFEGGLKQAGHLMSGVRGATVYGISSYTSLTPSLGIQWHVRGLNDQLNYCYVILETVGYYLHKQRDVEYTQWKRSV